jgi:hypothetical protein
VTDLAVRTCVLDMVNPVHNEERDLPGSVRRLHSYLATEVPYASQITVADNASTDSTLAVAQALADELPGVDVIHLDAKGRGGALYTAWMWRTWRSAGVIQIKCRERVRPEGSCAANSSRDHRVDVVDRPRRRIVVVAIAED